MGIREFFITSNQLSYKPKISQKMYFFKWFINANENSKSTNFKEENLH